VLLQAVLAEPGAQPCIVTLATSPKTATWPIAMGLIGLVAIGTAVVASVMV
jgi:hypothetical protein